jgi:redox-sensitive bicupin YhaK (pirin superfamily)
MTAGNGVSHSEEGTGTYSGDLHGVQLWIAQPTATRNGPAAFEHHSRLPQAQLGSSIATVLVGDLAGAVSPARRDTDHVGIDLELNDRATLIPLRMDYEYGLVVLSGAVTILDRVVEPGQFAYLGTGRDELQLLAEERSRALLIGGIPFDEKILMWWNFVARTQEEIISAYRDWAGESSRFGEVASSLERINTAPPPWGLRSR